MAIANRQRSNPQWNRTVHDEPEKARASTQGPYLNGGVSPVRDLQRRIEGAALQGFFDKQRDAGRHGKRFLPAAATLIGLSVAAAGGVVLFLH
jgi:hypothetical protein